MSEHTPGPWRKEYDYGAYNIEADSPSKPGKTTLVACAVSERDVPIILAAPTLLAERDSLRAVNAELLEALEWVSRNPGAHHSNRQAVVDAAIASARNLVKVKGRYNTEQSFKALVATLENQHG